MRNFIGLSLAVALVSLPLSLSLPAQTSDPAQHLKELARANSLDEDGMQPWHLRMSFQLNDLRGKPGEQGTIEEWWLSPNSMRLEIRSASYNLTIPADSGSSNTGDSHGRESYLVDELLNQVEHPIPDFSESKDLQVTESDRAFGKVTLSCISVARPPRIPTEFCFSPGSSILRGQLGEGQFAAVRNRIATFRGIELGLDNTLAYAGKPAITGHVDVLESFKPDPSMAVTTGSEGRRRVVVIPGVVLAGHVIKKVSPVYPPIARQNHIAGTVILRGTISTQGTVSALDVISSPDPSLTASALDAVKRWTYQPYLLNGQPTEVVTTVSVNYNLSW